MMLTFPSFLRRAFFVGPGSFWLKVDLVVVSVSLVRGRRDPPPPPPSPPRRACSALPSLLCDGVNRVEPEIHRVDPESGPTLRLS